MVDHISPFEPINQVTPFTYRDNHTYLTILRGVREKINETIEHINNLDIAMRADFTEQINATIDDFNSEVDRLDAGNSDIRKTIVNNVNTLNGDIDTINNRITDLWSTSNTGLDERVTAAEQTISDAIASYESTPNLSNNTFTGAELLAGLADTQNGGVTLAIASDSTGNDPLDWVRLFYTEYAKLITAPELRREYRVWNDATQTWTATVDNAGVSVPGTNAIVASDTFARVGEIVGSAPNTGPAWNGKAGVWTADGSHARATSGVTGVMSVEAVDGYGSPIKDGRVDATINLITSASPAIQSYRFHIGGVTPTSDNSGITGGVFAALFVSATGAFSGGLYFITAGGSLRTIASFTDLAGIVSVSAAEQIVNVSVSITAGVATATLQKGGGTIVTISGALTDAEYASIGGWRGVAAASPTTPGFALDSINISVTPIPIPSTQPGIVVRNGSIAGATLAYHKSRIVQMFPNRPDILLISIGHNYQRMSGAEFTNVVADYIAACVAVWGGATPRIIISSQNPQKDSAVGVVEHGRRQAALRVWCMSKGYQYLPAFEHFSGFGDDFESLMADAIHPNTPPSWPLPGGSVTKYGAVEWMNLLYQSVRSRRFR